MNDYTTDLLVIGAGASGANVAYEATKRGLSVALLDAGDISGATSCRSSKLLHGGVRYLEIAFKTLDFAQLNLVREALLERSYWLNQAPFLTKRLELALPTESCLSKAYYRIGLGAYDLLSGNKNIGNSRLISNSDLIKSLPMIRENLNGGVVYSDGQFDDSRLNILLVLTAKKSGAIIRTYTKVLGFEKNSYGKITGAISENIKGQQERWNSKIIINATGIKSDSIRQKAEIDIPSRMLTSRGVHLVLKDNLCPEGIGLLLPSTDDGRVLFMLPFFGHTQVGTTDIQCDIDEAYSPSKEEENYLIDYVKRWFPKLKEPIIKSSWAGGRPLLKPLDENIKSSRVVREHEIEKLPSGLISIMGGKWTTSRSMAIDALKEVEAEIGKPLKATKTLPLLGTGKNLMNTYALLKKQEKQLSRILPQTPLIEKQIKHLESNYGLEALEIVSNFPSDFREPLSDVIPICQAEIIRAIKEENALTPTDILARRCRLAMVDLEEAKRILPIVQETLSQAGLPEGQLNLEK